MTHHSLMLLGAATYLIPSVIYYGLLSVALLTLVAAFFLDRSRGRRRCPRCWYDMSATSGLQCSECGRAVRSERSLHRTRRNRKGIAIALLIGLLGSVAPRVYRSGWRGAIPTTVLVWCVGRYEPPERYVRKIKTPPSSLASELATRLDADEPW